MDSAEFRKAAHVLRSIGAAWNAETRQLSSTYGAVITLSPRKAQFFEAVLPTLSDGRYVKASEMPGTVDSNRELSRHIRFYASRFCLRLESSNHGYRLTVDDDEVKQRPLKGE